MTTKRKSSSVYERIRDRPETIDELVTDFVCFKAHVYDLIRKLDVRLTKVEQVAKPGVKVRAIWKRIDLIENDYVKLLDYVKGKRK